MPESHGDIFRWQSLHSRDQANDECKCQNSPNRDDEWKGGKPNGLAAAVTRMRPRMITRSRHPLPPTIAISIATRMPTSRVEGHSPIIGDPRPTALPWISLQVTKPAIELGVIRNSLDRVLQNFEGLPCRQWVVPDAYAALSCSAATRLFNAPYISRARAFSLVLLAASPTASRRLPFANTIFRLGV